MAKYQPNSQTNVVRFVMAAIDLFEQNVVLQVSKGGTGLWPVGSGVPPESVQDA